jgi:hypothetical protein
MYILESEDDFRRLVKKLSGKYKRPEWPIYPTHSQLMYEAMEKYIKEKYGSNTEV